jgi:hypothetical protein
VGVGTILEFSVIRSSSQGNAVADTTPDQRETKGLAVVASIRRQAHRTGARPTSATGNLYLGQGQGGGSNIGHVACGQIQPYGQSVAIDDEVPFRGFTRPGATDFVAPFLAFT